MIEALAQRTFHLSTVNTSYILRITDTGHAEHLYYGRKLRNVEASVTAMREKHYTAPGMGTYTDPDFPSFVLDDAPLEMTTEGRGDYRIPLAAISLGEDGERTFNPLFLKHRISKGTKPFGGLRLPQAKDAFGDAETLELIFSDRERNITLGLVYTLFPALDVIVRRSVLTNASGKTLRVRSLASAQLDFRETGMKALTLHGTWGREMEKDIRDIHIREQDARIIRGGQSRLHGDGCARRLLCAQPHLPRPAQGVDVSDGTWNHAHRMGNKPRHVHMGAERQ